ncbi:MAG TPA: hypothetical protein VLI90_03320, partial [Tepidisphaeraceae bacterium]|nr:hypothetical protein [Tepidisphaeraceae bacterium]
TQPAMRPTMVATTSPAAKLVATYMDAVRTANPLVPATQPLALPVDLSDAAHLIVHDAVYLDPLGHLWIARRDARPTAEALRNPADVTEHVVADAPAFVHWWIDGNGDWAAAVIARGSSNSGGWDIITLRDRAPLGADRPFHWQRAYSWDGKFVVPSDGGVSVFEMDGPSRFVEHYHALAGAPASPPLTVLDAKGVLAWSPWERGQTGSRGASRYVDGSWSDLSPENWGERFVQLIPLLDGSVLQIIAGAGAGEDDHVSMSIAPLESTQIDQHHVEELVTALADPDDAKRHSAFDELSRYGPGLWPILEKLADDQPAEARVAIKQLLRSKTAPGLGGLTLIGDRLTVVNRQNDGSVLLFAPLGVKIGNGDSEPQVVTPAWISLRPGGRVERPLPVALVKDLRADLPCHLRAVRDDWIISDEGGGPRRFVGNGFVPLVRPDERTFTQLIGEDRRGRWVFSKPSSSEASTRASASTQTSVAETLIIDPTILDPAPRLPVWTMTIQKGVVGWDGGDWPVIKRGGAWALKSDSWEPLPEQSAIITEMPALPSAHHAATQPTTAESLGRPLRVTSDGTRYYDGRTWLVTIDKSGHQTRWPLPASAVGSMDPPTLIRTADGQLFLFNQPGRVLRIAPTPEGSEPFRVEATFTKDIPNVDHPARIWLDPLGRIDIAYNANCLAVLFPSGHIPMEISQMMDSKN